MIETLFLENFKAFGRPTELELAPITLFFGQNSAGKSSILQALNLLKQTQRANESGVALLPRAEDAISDLGSFRELVFDHDCERSVTLGVGQRSARVSRRGLGGFLLSDAWMGMQLTFSQPKASVDVRMSGMRLSCRDFREPLATFEMRPADRKEYREVLRRPYFSMGRLRRTEVTPARLQVAHCIAVSESANLWQPIYDEWRKRSNKIVEALRGMQRPLPEDTSAQAALFEEEDVAEIPNRREVLSDAISFYEAYFSLEQFTTRMACSLLQTTLFVNGQSFFSNPLAWQEMAPEFRALSASAQRERSTSMLRVPCPILSMAVMDVANELERSLISLFPMGPFRRPPERWYIYTGTSPGNVGYKGQSLPDLLFRRPELVEKANYWLQRLSMGYQLRIASVGGTVSDLFEVRLVDTRRKTPVEVALSDVGFGVSQILPFLVQSLTSDKQIISIEQPEVHIHPRLQADLGDLLAATIKEPYHHQFLIETHSEHLMLRLQRLVREGTLKQEDVAVIYVLAGAEGSSATRLRLDKDGDFIDEWPGGFFPERRREL